MLSTDNKKIAFYAWIKDIVLIAVAMSLLYSIFLGWYALFTPDEGRYSEVAREMVVTGDYISPHLNGVIFLDKPILYYWLQALSIHLFGLKEWALRFWPVCLGILGTIMTYVGGRILFDRRTGILSAIILATSPMYYGGAHYANLDLEVAVLISCSLLSFIIALQSSSTQQRLGFLLAAYVFTGLAVLTKGLIGIAFPAIIVGSWIILLNRWKSIPKMRLFTGLVIFLCITAPWFLLVQKANPQFFHYFFVEQQFSRFIANGQYNNQSPGWFYIPIVLVGLIPWSVFFFQALYQHIKSIFQNYKHHANELYLVIWFIFIFTFFSIPKSKTLGYILPVFPAAALLIGSYLNRFWDSFQSKGIYYGIISFIVLSEIAVICVLTLPLLTALGLDPAFLPYIAMIGIIFSLGMIGIMHALAKKSVRHVFIYMSAIACAFLLAIISSANVINHKSIKPLAMQIKPILTPNDEIVTYYRYYQDLPIYLERRISIVAKWHADDIPLFDNWLRELWLGMPYQDTSNWLIEETEFWKRWNSDKRLFVLMNSIYFRQFSERSNGTIYRVGTYGDVYLVTNKLTPVVPIIHQERERHAGVNQILSALRLNS